MNALKNIVVCFSLLILLQACGAFILPELGKSYSTRLDMKLVPQTKWNVTNGPVEQIWTKNGPLLDRVDVYGGLEDGDVLVRVWGKENPHHFKKGMTSLEVVELYKNSLTFSGGINVEIGEIKPAKLGGQDGFEFEFSLRDSGGLKKKGLVRGAISNEKLYLMSFNAPVLHYYDLVYADALELMGSAQLPATKEMAKK